MGEDNGADCSTTEASSQVGDVLLNIFDSLNSLRFNLKSRRVELRCPKDQEPNLTHLQKGEDFVRAFSLGFEVDDAISLIRLDHMFLESFEVTDGEYFKGLEYPSNFSQAPARRSP